MRFAALDFETATASRDSACALGVCLVEDGGIVEQAAWLIRPPGNAYHPFNTSLHGIGPADTADASSFADVITEAWQLLDGVPLVAHNAAFDMSVLRRGLDSSELDYPTTEYYCTLLMSRAHWPELPGYALPIVLAKCGLSHNHHEAASDAAAAAEVLLQIGRETGAKTLPRIASCLGVRPGRLHQCGYTPCKGPGPRCSKPGESKVSAIKVATDADPGHPFYDADVAFTGTLLCMTRPEAMKRVGNCGGRPRTTVSLRTEYLVVGTVEYRSLSTGAPSRKLQKALALRSDGAPLVMLSEAEFIQYL